ncbi:MAG: ATP-dependent helicase, partial [bacterium]
MRRNLLLNGLDRVQSRAALATGYVRVLGGPGTGKTKLLATRLCQLIQSGVDQRNILTFTFNEKMMMAMRSLIAEMTGKLPLTNIFTFHGFCFNIVIRNLYRGLLPKQSAWLPQFTVIDRAGQLGLLRWVYYDLEVFADKYPPEEMLAHIAMLKRRLDYVPHLHPEVAADLADDIGLDINDGWNEIFINYLIKQSQYNQFDADDMLYFTLYLLRQHPDLLDYWQNELQHIQVDDCQDISQPQFDLLTLLQGKHQNLCVAGDQNQAIYSAQGGDSSFLNNFDGYFPGTQTFMLTENHRSDFSIFTAFNSLIKYKEQLEPPAAKIKGRVYSYRAEDAADEAKFIARHTEKMCSIYHAQYQDIAILYPAGQRPRLIEEALSEAGIPYTVAGGIGFYCRPAIKDALAFLRLLVYGDNISFERIINKPDKDMSGMRAYALKQYALKHKVTLMQALLDCAGLTPYRYRPIIDFIEVFKEIKAKLGVISTSQALAEILDKTGYEEWVQFDLNADSFNDISELKLAIEEQEEAAGGRLDIAGYLTRVELYAGFAAGQHPNSVQLMSISSSKGMEFPFVTVCGLNEGVLPSQEGDIDEERRL